MAKKTKKKTSKPAKKAAHKPVKRAASKAAPTAPRPVSTGRGPSAAEVGAQLVALFNAGKLKEIESRFWSPDVVSIEGVGVNMAWHGRKAVEAKNEWWAGDHEMHGASAEGPYVGSSGFAVKYRLDILTKSSGLREIMEEVGVYEIKNGKIVREEFMYGSRQASGAPPTATPQEQLAPIGG